MEADGRDVTEEAFVCALYVQDRSARGRVARSSSAESLDSANGPGPEGMSQMQGDLQRIAGILAAIGSATGLRSERRAGDLEGPFDKWFEGGAIKVVTGWTEYHFADGAVAVVPITPRLRVDVRLATGAFFSVTMEDEVPPNMAYAGAV